MDRQNCFVVFVCCLLTSHLSQPAIAQEVGVEQGVASSTAGTYVVFDVPGASCPALSVCVTPSAINDSGTVIGSYTDANQEIHGFFRLKDGTTTSFDPPGAFCGNVNNPCTLPAAIDSTGAAIGKYWVGTNANYRGFIRASDGTITEFDPPQSIDTSPVAINPAGEITGSFYKGDAILHGFLRDSHGKFVVFDVPGAEPDNAHGTQPIAINRLGDIVGIYNPTAGTHSTHGFLRHNNGDLITLHLPGALQTLPVAIDSADGVYGNYYYGNNSSTFVGAFIRSTNGQYATLVMKDSAFTAFVAIDQRGGVVGQYYLPGVYSGFYRAADGTITTFAPPGAVETYPTGISPHGDVVGYFTEADSITHGFVRLAH